MKSSELLTSLENINWQVAYRTIGNNHSTLIGLFIQWWIDLDPERNTVLEGGPSNGYSKKSKKRGQCHALFLENGKPVGVLEVEGTRYLLTAKKIGYFFDAKYHDLSKLKFGVLVLYAYSAQGKGVERQLPDPINKRIINTVEKITKIHPRHNFLLIGINRKYKRIIEGIRSRTEYYMGEVSKVSGLFFKNGRKVHELVFFEK